MAVQDLTPQLRTRLSRVERLVGWFVVVATLLLLAGFAYYFYITAQRKGWFITKIPYYTYVRDATGLRPGDPVRLMGFDVGEIILVEATPAGDVWFTENQFNVFVQFVVKAPYYGYIWTDSRTRIGPGDFLGKRVLEVTKGATGEPTVQEGEPVRIHSDKPLPGTNAFDYVLLAQQPKGYWLPAQESPALTERFDAIANRVQDALPGFFDLTNRIAAILGHGSEMSTNVNVVLLELRPVVSNLTAVTAMLTNRNGSLGEWLLPIDVHTNLAEVLRSASATLDRGQATLSTTETNIVALSSNLNQVLANLAGVTGSLRDQVETNDAILAGISKAIIHADELVQGLKRHWLLRSAFKDAAAENPEAQSRRRRNPPPRAGKQW